VVALSLPVDDVEPVDRLRPEPRSQPFSVAVSVAVPKPLAVPVSVAVAQPIAVSVTQLLSGCVLSQPRLPPHVCAVHLICTSVAL